jgi:hypothetical protein
LFETDAIVCFGPKKCFQILREKSEAHLPETVLCRQAGSSISNFNNYAKRFADVFKRGKRCKLNLSKIVQNRRLRIDAV